MESEHYLLIGRPVLQNVCSADVLHHRFAGECLDLGGVLLRVGGRQLEGAVADGGGV